MNPLALSAQFPLRRARCLPRMVKKKPSTTNYTYKTWDTENRNWEIPRNRLVITEEKLGVGEFGIVTKGVYLRTDGNKLPVAVKRLKGSFC